MKTLKKVLSLVLVVAMIASMLIVGAAAAEETQYPEAAAVISGIKVMEGDERGMRYGDTVTREEAAAMICRLLLGDTAESLAIATTSAPFADVAASRWSAGYIAYLKGQGIISGVSATEFDPTAKVTGIAFAKMLLTAVGYGKAGEFDGAAWDINTVTFANDTGIFKGTKDLILTDAATREECMLYAYNALTIPTVKYNKTFESYYTGTSALTPVTDPAELMNYTLAALKFQVAAAGNTTDIYGRPAVNYTLAGQPLVSRVVNAEPVFVAENALTGGDIYAKLGAATVAKLTNVVVYVDGAQSGHFTKADIAYMGLTKAAFAGAKVEAYIVGTTLTLVTVYEHIDTVLSVDPRTGVATMAGGDKVVMPNAVPFYVQYVYTKSPIAAADDVLYSCNITSIAAATPIVGTFVKTNALGQYVVDGAAYVDSKNVVSTFTVADYGYQFNVYTDSLGNILKVVPVDNTIRSNEYVYVTASTATGYVAAAGFNAAVPASAKLKVVYTDGTNATVDYTITFNPVTRAYEYKLPGATVGTAVTNSWAIVGTEKVESGFITPGWYSYVTAEDGTITLVAAATTTTGLTLQKGKFDVAGALAGYKATSKTVVNVVNDYGTLETYTGIANFPNTTANDYKVMFEYDYVNKTITAINVYGPLASITVRPAAPVAFCAQYLYHDHLGYHYNFYVNGVATELVSAANNLVGGVYNLGYDAYGNYVVGAAVAADAAYNSTYFAFTNNVITVVDEQYFTVEEAIPQFDTDHTDVTSYYYNAEYMPTFVFDLAGGDGLVAGRTATIVVYEGTNCAQFIWLH